MAEPIILDETAKAINEELAEYNTWLNVIASRKIPELYTNPAAMAAMIRKGTVESNKKLFPVGDKIIVPWKDMNDPEHNTKETAYQVPFNIVHHAMVDLEDGRSVPGMYIQMDYLMKLDYWFGYSRGQAVYRNHSGSPLSPGAYNISFNRSPFNTDIDTYTFTLEKPLPVNGRIDCESGRADSNGKIIFSTWDTPTSMEPSQILESAPGTTGINLGVTSPKNPTKDMNNYYYIGEMACSADWSMSHLRQYLNSAEKYWFHSIDDFTMPPFRYDNYPPSVTEPKYNGFLSGFESVFIENTLKTAIKTKKYIASSDNVSLNITYDRCFIPSATELNVANGKTVSEELLEGTPFEYWARRSGTNKFINLGEKISSHIILPFNYAPDEYGKCIEYYTRSAEYTFGLICDIRKMNDRTSSKFDYYQLSPGKSAPAVFVIG